MGYWAITLVGSVPRCLLVLLSAVSAKRTAPVAAGRSRRRVAGARNHTRNRQSHTEGPARWHTAKRFRVISVGGRHHDAVSMARQKGVAHLLQPELRLLHKDAS